MFNSIFKIIYFIELVIAIIIRKSYERKFIKLDVEIQKKSTIDIIFLMLNGIGMTVPIVYVFSSWLDFANYSLPGWLGWLGVVLFAFAIWLLWRSHHDLDRNWTPTVAIRYDPELITSGVYKYIRHPMYSAHLVWAIAQIFILHNWVAGFSFLIVQVPFIIIRIKNEEKMMIEQFGKAYTAYMDKTDRLIPKLI
ncbi:protein-S-isoprenylcysteine O-methyltransferase [Bacteroidota bacterium]